MGLTLTIEARLKRRHCRSRDVSVYDLEVSVGADPWVRVATVTIREVGDRAHVKIKRGARSIDRIWTGEELEDFLSLLEDDEAD